MTANICKVLLIDDDEDDYIVTRDFLDEAEQLSFQLNWVDNYDDGLIEIGKNQHDLYLLDFRLGKGNGLELLEEAIAKGCNKPIILLTGLGDSEIDQRAMKSGASDYLVKGRFLSATLLERSIIHAIERKHSENRQLQLVGELAAVNQELKDFAYIVSHDLKAPLRGIASLADWLQKDYGDRLDDEGRDMLQMMSGRVRRMSDLIDGVLQYSRVGRVREDKNIIDLQALVHNTINAIAPPSGIKIEIDTNLPTLLAEKHRMHQVFQKLQQAIADLQQENQERLKIEDSLRESQKRFESLAAVAPVGIYRTNTTGDCIYVNDRWCEIAGLTAAEASGPNWARALHPEDRQKVGTEWYASVQKRRPFELECRFQKPDGTITWVLSRARAERDIYGEIIGYVGTITDISDRKQAEAELKQLNATLEVRVESRTRELQEREKNLEESQRLLQTVLDVFPLAVFWKDRQSILLGCNQVFAIAAGVTSPSEAVGKSNFDFSYSEEEKLKYTLDDRSVMESGVPKIGIHETITLANGEIQWIETNKIPLRDELGEVVGIVGTFQDISDRKFAEEALAESEAFNRQLVEEFPIGLASCRMDGQLVYVNSAFAKILGRTIEETLELTYWDITPIKYADQEAAQLESLQLEGRYSSYEKEYIHKDGYLVPVLLNGLVILQKGELIIWSSVQDISDRKQSETKLQLANEELMRATRLKDEFLANMSHELRTPLNSILGMNESLQDEVFGSINKRQLKALQTIESSSTHLLTLINDILDVAKIESGQITLNLTVTNIESLCTSSLAFIKQQALTKRVQLTARIPKDLPEIMLDERRMRQVLINLLNNAIKFTLEGGKITLEVSQVQLESSTTNLTLLNYLKIAVIDTGIGISAENIQKLFQPFIQIDSALNRQYNGTGLGLALVKRLVEIHGGTVELTSEVGVGSCFAINLPINIGSSEIEEQTNSDLSEQAQIGQSQTEELISPLILLAEDNAANIATFTSYLEANGYRILLATDGQQAIDLAKAEHPDLILMDIQMPVMDGLTAIKQICLDPNLADIPIIALTALAMAGDRDRCLEAGANEYLSKPIKLKALADTIRNILKNRNKIQ